MIDSSDCKTDRERTIVEGLNANKSTMQIAKDLSLNRKSVNNMITVMRSRGIDIPTRYKQRTKYKQRTPKLTNVTDAIQEIAKPKKDTSKFIIIKGEGKDLLMSILKDF